MNPNKLPFFRFKLFRIGLGLLGLLALLYVFVFLRSIIPTSVYDQELRLERADIPEGANAFDVLQEAGSHVWWPDGERERIGDLMGATNWDANFASELLDKNREAMVGWDAAAKLTDLQVSEISTVADLLPYLAAWKRMSEVAVVRENFLLRLGQDKAAFDQMMNQVQLGWRMQNSHGVLIGYLVGTAVNSMGLNQIQRWVGQSHLDARQLKNYIRQLEFDPDDEAAAFANTMRAEYKADVGSLANIRDGKIIDDQTGKYYPRPTRLWPTFNFSKTKALFAGGYLTLLKAAPLHYKDAEDILKDNDSKLPDFLHRSSPVSLIFSGNAAGQVMYYLMMPAIGESLAKKSQADVQLQATRTILALRAYELTHANLPPDLSALVPEFLDEVPVDDFDGQPLRYSAEKKIVYSVGQNLKDDGGDDTRSGPNDSHLDLVYKFDF